MRALTVGMIGGDGPDQRVQQIFRALRSRFMILRSRFIILHMRVSGIDIDTDAFHKIAQRIGIPVLHLYKTCKPGLDAFESLIHGHGGLVHPRLLKSRIAISITEA